MKADIIRQKFLDYFQARGHHYVPSSSLVPAGDPTLLFTNAGMVQFKDVFLGLESRPYRRAVSAQKCMRAGGKHNDLDQVGRTARHQTFFEMLGNFSFGDYFKRDAIRFAWGFLTEAIGIDPEVLWVSVFETDDEAYDLWRTETGIAAERIVRLGEKDNFWSMGETGPCGPSSEIFVDRGEAYRCGPDCGLGRCDCDRVQEIWNLVFMQFDRDAEGVLHPLPRPSIDTGMGLERVAAYLQGVDSNFDTDLLRPLIDAIAAATGRPYDRGEGGMPFRVIADHVRAVSFLLAEGLAFSNVGRGYVMRRILRRAVRYGLLIGFEEPFLARLVPVVVEVMGDAYPEIREGQTTIERAIRREEERFFTTLNAGMAVLAEELAAIPEGGELAGETAFMLYDTYGFPLDLTEDAARERGVRVDRGRFDALMAAQRERARSTRKYLETDVPVQPPVVFHGYERLELDEVEVGRVQTDEGEAGRIEAGETGYVWVPETPFYAEGGGQVGDQGEIEGPSGRFRVLDVVRRNGSTWHWGEQIAGRLEAGDRVRLAVDPAWRQGARQHHTATHLLHAALRQVLGPTARQTGSLVAPDRLRFDFSHPEPLTPAEIDAIEDLVNTWVLENLPVVTEEKSKAEALAGGAIAFFGDKYGDQVRVVSVPGASQELCGGTHCRATGDIGCFLIVQETSVGSGMRRIEAVAGMETVRRVRAMRAEMIRAAEALKVPTDRIGERAEEAIRQLRRAEAELKDARRAQREATGRVLADAADAVGPFRVLVREVGESSVEGLRQIVDGLKERVDAAVLAGGAGAEAALVVYLSRRLTDAGLDAGRLVKAWAPLIGGGGGGRREFAQAGGKRPDGLPSLMRTAAQDLRGELEAVTAGR